MRLTLRDLKAMADCAHFVLAGDWEQDAHGDVTREDIENALQKLYAQMAHRTSKKRAA